MERPPPDPVADDTPAERSDDLMAALLAVADDLPLPDLLERVVDFGREALGARYAALGVVGEDGRLVQFVQSGVDDATVAAIGHLPEGRGVLGTLIRTPEPVRIREIAEHPDSVGFPEHHPVMHAFLGVPVQARGEVFGNLYFANEGDQPFEVDDEQRAVALAAAVGIAVENHRIRTRTREIVLLRERERIAHELHDRVIQRLFAVGLTLEAAASQTDDEECRTRMADCVDQLDETIRELRGTVFELGDHAHHHAGPRTALAALVDETAPALGFRPRLVLEGPIDTATPSDLLDDLLATLTEALGNVARHARATRVDVTVTCGSDLVLEVLDDGVGIPVGWHGAPGHHGLENMDARARDRGGTFSVSRRPEGGTRLVWRAPIVPGG